jgi:hypothetical protein
MFIELHRTKPTSVMPASAARSTASEDGADTADRVAMPALSAFWVSSNDALPLTCRMQPRSGSRSSRSAHPMTLSTALCLSTSSRRHSSCPSLVNSPAAWVEGCPPLPGGPGGGR